MLDDFYDKFYIFKICFSIIIRNIFWAVEDISNLADQVQSRRLNAVAYTLPRGVHMYATGYTLCPVQDLAR